jgi:hypothetical protein
VTALPPSARSGALAVRAGHRIMSGAAATLEVGPEKRRAQKNLGDLRTSPQNWKLNSTPRSPSAGNEPLRIVDPVPEGIAGAGVVEAPGPLG